VLERGASGRTKRSPLDCVVDALRARGCDPRRNGGGYSAKCPAHDDRVASLTATEGHDGRALVKCHAGDGCSFAAIAGALDLPESSFFPPKKKNTTKSIVATYDYADERGELLFQVVRYSPKAFKQRRPDGRGGWKWNLEGVKRVLYGLPHVLSTAEVGGTVYVVEGEKDADAVVRAGGCATTNPGGAGKWRDSYAQYLRGAERVVVIADADDKGREHARQVAASVRPHVDDVTTVEPRVGKDVADHLAAGHSLNELVPVADEPQSSDGELPSLDLDPEQAQAVNELLDKFKDLDEGEQKNAMRSLAKLFGKETQATELVKLALDAGVELWHDRDGTGYASLPVGNHVEHWPIRSRAVRLWLRRSYYEESESAPNANAVRDAVEVLDGRALFASDEHDVHVRVGASGGAVYLDLCDDEWRCIEVTAAGWTVRNGAPVRFKRARGMLTLPVPQPGGDVAELRPFVNVTDDEWPLVLGVLVGAFRPRGPYPVLDVTGEHGSAKTTLCRALRRCIDPNKAEMRAAPSETRDLAIAAANGWVCVFDNLSSLWPKLSDDLARLSTGAGFSTRKLYEDDEEQLFDACRPVVVNGIEDVVVRPDLLDRAVIIHPPRIDDPNRRDEEEFWRAFDEVRPRIVGALLDAVACALARQESVRLAEPPRMADFAKWVVAAEPALGLAEGDFLDRYRANRDQASTLALEASEVTAAILAFVNRKGSWSGSAGELARLLEPDKPPKGWPRSPQGMAGALKRSAPVLRQHGVNVDLEERTHAGRRWTLTKSEDPQ
jgi:hypothetical protein